MKLKKLILTGFKSFAKKTEFEFDDGVSCVVGPNGCGKSNIVDAVKWVLGERSAKSLRGEEMADVIFNGSAVRPAAGMAEVRLIFENNRGLLKPNVSGGESNNGLVSVGRRLYRSGQSEYLVNNTPCRLKDILEMFMDTGIGVEAYSLIEQGKVETFLQASQDERRGIFDEAAGISKYKARKKETLRKLERVEQNLLRLSDILGEIEKRLRSIKYQAGKARSHQAHSQRLRELRSLYFLAQYHIHRQQRSDLQRVLDAGNDALASKGAMIERLESAQSAADVEAVDLERTGRELEGKIATVGGQIAAAEQRVQMLSSRVKEIGEQIVSASSKCEELEAKIVEHDEQIRARNDELGQVQHRSAALAEESEAAAKAHAAQQQALSELEKRLEDTKAAAIDLMRQAAQLSNEISALSIRKENLQARRARLEERSSEISTEMSEAASQRSATADRLRAVRETIAATESQLAEAKNDARALVDSERQLLKELSEGRERRSAIESRIGALTEMNSRLEGVGAGTRRVVEAHRQGRLKTVRGMLADFLETDVQHAPLVEAALDGFDELLIADGEPAEAAAEVSAVLGDNGAAELLCTGDLRAMKNEIDAGRCDAVVGRLIDHVRFPADAAPIVWRLLGHTLIVRDLKDASAAAAMLQGCRFVTLSGEVMEADGRIKLGCAKHTAGLVTRRSELTDLRGQQETLAARIAEMEQRHAAVRSRIEETQALEQRLRTAAYEANTERVEVEGSLKALDEQTTDLANEQQVIAAEIKAVAEETEAADRAERQAKASAEQLDLQKSQCDRDIEQLQRAIAEAKAEREAIAARMTELKVALAAAEEKASSLRDLLAGLTGRQEQMRLDVEKDRGEIALNRERREQAAEGIRKTREEIDRLYAEQQRLSKEAEEVEQSRSGLQKRFEDIRRELTQRRKEHQELSEQVNVRKVELGEVDVRIEGLISRAGDEMSMNLLELYGSYQHDENRDWDAVKAEIQELNEKIQRLGNINLDAISEQEELEQRRQFLGAQLDDIKSSRNQINELIRRINKESRDRFLETFEATRKNFHELFRKLFGGGRADIMLLNPDDVLESGIEILARPPGKELRSLSLLSGGEKTMTALALLFSIFQTRPSPFCLLDEVDAALDETNTERFGELVREFVRQSQFIIISHAKRTMSMANVLYGVTMQEPGVSTRISVRFEDVGHKLDDQLQPVKA